MGDLVVQATGEPERPRGWPRRGLHRFVRRRKELFDDCRYVFLQLLKGTVGKALACRLIQRGLVEAGLLALTIQSATWENADATRSKATVSTGGTSVSASTRYSNGYFSSTTLDTSAAANALLTKTVTGTDFAEKTFDFSVTPVDGAPAPTEQTGSATFSAAGSQSVSFGTITFTKVGTNL